MYKEQMEGGVMGQARHTMSCQSAQGVHRGVAPINVGDGYPIVELHRIVGQQLSPLHEDVSPVATICPGAHVEIFPHEYYPIGAPRVLGESYYIPFYS